jgi:hypothetical protein
MPDSVLSAVQSNKGADMKTRLKTVALVGIGLTTLTLTQGCTGNELTRRRAFELLSAELARQGPVRDAWPLGSTSQIRTPDNQPNIDLNKVMRDLEVLFRMSDDDYAQLLPKVAADYEFGPAVRGIPVADPTIRAMRELWKTGRISRFAWKSEYQQFWGGHLLSVVGVVKPELQSMCDGEPYRVGDNRCVRIVAERTVKSITGIRDFDEFVRVEFELTITPTTAGQSLGRQPVTRKSAANFVLYDDGWRVQPTLFPYQ